jgi:UDP-N-acetylglucosamine--N-acetylmuramyl-(pentapeptide) pyrophosphoryl-undecaprenol N-acetylglucosamine transferase
MVTVLIAGGGTGGHVFPMIAVGDAVRALDPSARVVYCGTSRGIEARVIPEQGGELELLHVIPLRGGGVRTFLKGVTRAAGSLPEARAMVKRLRPDVVLSVGGYAAGPVSLAARFQGVPVTMLEPNSVLGLANRLLSPFAARAYVAFPEAERFLRPSVVRRSGVPLRRAFAPASYAPGADALSVLVLGGSQGSQALNAAVPRAIAAAAGRGIRVSVVHQTGRDREAEVRALYAELDLDLASARVVPFIDDVAAALGAADVVIERAGASSLAELCAVGRPSILIPYPFAADDHQHKNALSLERKGAAVALAQPQATPARIADELVRLARDPERRARMARAAGALGKPDAAAFVARDLLNLARAGSQAKEAS